MSCVIIIRDYKQTDLPSVSEVVRNAYLSQVSSSWFNALTREVTFQLVVMTAAILFIFVGVPLLYCLVSIPIVLATIYIVIYSSLLMKATELMYSKKPLHCWVAEACEPLIFLQQPETVYYRIMTEERVCNEGFDMGNYRRKIIGTVSVIRHLHLENSAWLFRLAINSRYKCKGVAHALVHMVQNWCRSEQYDTLEMSMSECQESSRQLFVDNGFEIKQLYHRQLVGSMATLLMYQLGCELRNLKPSL